MTGGAARSRRWRGPPYNILSSCHPSPAMTSDPLIPSGQGHFVSYRSHQLRGWIHCHLPSKCVISPAVKTNWKLHPRLFREVRSLRGQAQEVPPRQVVRSHVHALFPYTLIFLTRKLTLARLPRARASDTIQNAFMCLSSSLLLPSRQQLEPIPYFSPFVSSYLQLSNFLMTTSSSRSRVSCSCPTRARWPRRRRSTR